MKRKPKLLTARDMVARSAYKDNAVASFVERYGHFFSPRPLPRRYRPGEIKACFTNAFTLAVCHAGLTYVEGLALAETTNSLSQLHAWCVNARGQVIDPTWRSGAAYYGVPFRTDYLIRVIQSRNHRYYGLLDDWQQEYPLVTDFADKPELWLASIAARLP